MLFLLVYFTFMLILVIFQEITLLAKGIITYFLDQITREEMRAQRDETLENWPQDLAWGV